MSEPIYNGELPVITSQPEPAANVQPAHDLGAIIPTVKGRKLAYAIYAGIALIVTNTVVGFAAANSEQPVWLVVATAIVGNLAAPFSAIAIANAKQTA